MNDVEELKSYVGVHARGQRIARYQEVLDRIRTDGSGPGSWVHEWVAAGQQLERRGRHLEASRHYLMARFPFVDGPDRKDALDRAAASFERWSTGRDVSRLEVDVDGGRVGLWQSGLSPVDRRPLLLVMGGIVTVKEQWAPVLPVFRRMGMAAVALEMPGTGENPLRYGPESWRMLSGVLDALRGRADVANTYALTLSFSGHLALRCAVDDPRIRGVVTAGAPVAGFFTDRAWQRALPRVTVDALAHMAATDPGEVLDSLAGCALTDAQLSGLDVPVRYISSLRDEIIPPGDVARLRAHLRDLEVVEYDDVHGAPDHAVENQLWCARSLLRMRGVRSLRGAVIGGLWRARRSRARLAGRR
ncbi:alpha/beta fold hydrolase [Kitasatospora sp. NPDC058032]|uniref:alpha/beta fold hydrolase n=1 Tax=Kitasatospora sp. NPDC058032 TaxID=3346307 RepID=UPI0036DF6922